MLASYTRCILYEKGKRKPGRDQQFKDLSNENEQLKSQLQQQENTIRNLENEKLRLQNELTRLKRPANVT